VPQNPLRMRLSKGQKGMHGRSPKKPTVGREDDPQRGARAAYRRVPFLGGCGVPGVSSLHPKG